MLIRKTHLIGGIALILAASAFYLQENMNDASVARTREANVASCTREVTRDAYEAVAFLTLAERARDDKSAVAERYEAAALSIADTFPKPGTAVSGRDMIQVQFVQGPGDAVRFRLTDESTELIAAGCRQAF